MKITTKRIAIIGLTAALYVALTIISPSPYGFVQCRLSEIMNLLAFFNPVFAPGIVLGCFVSNIFSPSWVLDIVLGTLHTITAMYFITRSKNLFIASLWPTVFSFIIGFMIIIVEGKPYLFENFVVVTAFVMLGEFIAVTLIGYPIFLILTKKNPKIIEYLKNM